MSKQSVGGQFVGPGGARLPLSKAILAAAGCTLDDVVKCTCWLDDPRDFTRFNVAYAQYFSSEPPARSTVVAKLVQDAKLEIEAIAYKPA